MLTGPKQVKQALLERVLPQLPEFLVARRVPDRRGVSAFLDAGRQAFRQFHPEELRIVGGQSTVDLLLVASIPIT